MTIRSGNLEIAVGEPCVPYASRTSGRATFSPTSPPRKGEVERVEEVAVQSGISEVLEEMERVVMICEKAMDQ